MRSSKFYFSIVIKCRLLTILVLLNSCVEPIEIELGQTAKTIVVDASLTNETRAHYAKISFSSHLDESSDKPVRGAKVWIENDQSNRINMTEIEPGYYVTDSTYKGEVGRSYALTDYSV